MTLDLLNAGLFVTAAVILLGSPGPGIAALVAVGKARGFFGGLRFLSGLLVGLALAAGVSAAGLAAVPLTIPGAATVLSIAAGAYLAWLAWRIATAPVGAPEGEARGGVLVSARSGFLLGISNPKAYLAFASLMPAYAVVRADPSADAGAKWLLCMLVIIVVDVVWLGLGGAVGRVPMTARAERVINVAMGGAILATVGLTWL